MFKKKMKKKEEKKDERAVKIDIECIEKGMVAAVDVFNDYGTIIVRKNRSIEGKHILLMRLSNIKEIEVIPPEKPEQEVKKALVHIRNYPDHIKKLENAKVLIVDDSKSARLLLKAIIEEAGLKVVGAAGNNNEALERIEKFRPSCITLDISMPGGDGTNIIKPIMSKYPNIKIVMVSSLSYEDVMIESLELGAVQFISKPFDHESFKKILIETIIKE